MSIAHEGGCLCGDVRYTTTADPIVTTVCHCCFCQRFTGSAFLVEPIFRRAAVVLSGRATKRYDHCSAGSGLRVSLNSCARCSTTLYLDFERFPDVFGVCGGTFDDPNWFTRGPESCRHIFTRHAQTGVVLPAGVPTFSDHELRLDGSSHPALVLVQPLLVSRA